MLTATMLLLNLIAGLIMLLSMADDPSVRQVLCDRRGRVRSPGSLAMWASIIPSMFAVMVVHFVIFRRRP